MDFLPVEILEIVFLPLSKNEDIEKCFNINSKWRQIIGNMFANKSKILVSGGFSGGIENLPLEIIDLINTKSKSDIVVDENVSRTGATGGILQNQILICGGNDGDGIDKTNVSVIGSPNLSFEMTIPRRHTSSVVLNESKIWVTGGVSNDRCCVNSTEIISLDQPPVPGPYLPIAISQHSMVLVDESAIYLIGGSLGLQNWFPSMKTWIIDPTNYQIKVGPSLCSQRKGHSCSKMRIEGRNFLIVAGGCNRNGPLDTVELLDTTNPDQGWKMGPKLPFSLFGSSMVSSPTEKGILMIGGQKNIFGPLSSDLLELSGDSFETLKWKILEKKLQYPRANHMSLSISNDIAATLTMKSIASPVQSYFWFSKILILGIVKSYVSKYFMNI